MILKQADLSMIYTDHGNILQEMEIQAGVVVQTTHVWRCLEKLDKVANEESMSMTIYTCYTYSNPLHLEKKSSIMSLHHAFYINQAKWQTQTNIPNTSTKKKTSGNSKPKKISQVKLQTFNPRTLFFPTFGSSSAAQSSVGSFLESEGIQRWKSPLWCIGWNHNTYDLCLYRLLLLFCWWISSGFFFHARPPLHPKSNLTGCYRQGDPSADGWEEATLAWASTKNSCGGVGYWYKSSMKKDS